MSDILKQITDYKKNEVHRLKKKQSIKDFENITHIYENKLFHCYNDNKQIDVF